jgi:transcriptional regulator with XRE-family HTH domain
LNETKIGDRIRILRGEASVAAFARQLGVSPDTIQLWEIGKVKPPRTRIRDIGWKLGVRVEWLRDGEGEMKEIQKALTNIEMAIIALCILIGGIGGCIAGRLDKISDNLIEVKQAISTRR